MDSWRGLKTDDNNGHLIVTTEILTALSTPDYSEYVKIKEEESFYSFQGIEIKVKGKEYLSPYSAQKLKIRNCLPASITVYDACTTEILPAGADEEIKVVGDINSLAQVYNSLLKLEVPLNITPTKLSLWLAPFMFYKSDFIYTFGSYFDSLDEGLTIVSSEALGTYLDSMKVIWEDKARTKAECEAKYEITPEETASRLKHKGKIYTAAQMRISSMFLFLCFNKRFVSPEHFEKFKKTRVQVLVNLMGLSETPELIFTNELFMGISIVAQRIPKLICELFRFIKSESLYPELASIKTLCAYLGLSFYQFIVTFINASKRTLAHRNYQILKEVSAFFNHRTNLKKRFGEEWIFIWYLSPSSIDTLRVKYPNLCYASHAYMKSLKVKTDEEKAFFNHMTNLKKRFGEEWIFIWYLSPSSIDTLRIKYPNLCYASHAYMKSLKVKTDEEKEPIENFQVGRLAITVAGIDKMVITEEKHIELYHSREIVLSSNSNIDDIRIGLNAMGIDFNKYKALTEKGEEEPKASVSSTPLALDDNTAALFAQFLEFNKKGKK